jgi:cell division protein FtsB
MRVWLRVLAGALVAVVVLLQWRLWASPEGFRGVSRLQGQVAEQREENAALLTRNRRLEAEVVDLKKGFVALEERARSDLGLVGQNETFYVYSDQPRPDAPAR